MRRRLSKAEREAVYQKTNGHCAYCGCDLAYKDMQVDHVKALYIGGKDEIGNYLPACRSCNRYKSTFGVEDFRKRLQRLPKVMKRDSVNFKNMLRFGIIEVKEEPIVFYFEKNERCREWEN